MSQWRSCRKDPPETGKKVLCHRKGDIYVAMRLKQYYLPLPFCDHYFCDELCFPDTWCEIDFPEGLTGHLRVCMNIPGHGEVIMLSEMEVDFPEQFNKFAADMISSIATLEKSMKKDRKKEPPP